MTATCRRDTVETAPGKPNPVFDTRYRAKQEEIQRPIRSEIIRK